jgi:hypothetical protein
VAGEKKEIDYLDDLDLDGNVIKYYFDMIYLTAIG